MCLLVRRLHANHMPTLARPPAVAASGGDLRAWLTRKTLCQPVVTFAAALAAGELRTTIELDGAPQLSLQKGVLHVKIMEAKSSAKGAPAAWPRCRDASRHLPA